jgi:hypothetical protein
VSCKVCGLAQGHNIGDVGFLRPLPNLFREAVVGPLSTQLDGQVYERFAECGETRKDLLRYAYRGGRLPFDWRLWACPYSGGWHAIDRGDVHWETSGILMAEGGRVNNHHGCEGGFNPHQPA